MIIGRKAFITIISSVILIIAIIISLFIFSCTPEKTVETTATVKEKKPNIVIDAGHGGEDGGAVADDGTVEKDINLKISLVLRNLFTEAGYNVTMTRDKDVALYHNDEQTIKSKKVADMKKRLEIYNSNSNNIIISIHQNKFEEKKYSGAQVFYSPNNDKSKLLAEAVRNSIVSSIQKDNKRETKEATNSIYLLWNTTQPAIIVECGFLSNNNELNLLKNQKYQNKMAYAIFDGTLNYIKKDMK